MTDHPSLDELADLAAGLPVDSAVTTHVAGCAVCAAGIDQIDQVSAALRELPAEPIPAAVAARIDAALAAEGSTTRAPTTVVPLEQRRRWSVPSWAAAAAAAVVLFGGGALLVSNLDGGSAKSTNGGSTVAGGFSKREVVRSTGLDYRAATLADQLPALLGQVAADQVGTSTAAGGAPAPAAAPAEAPSGASGGPEGSGGTTDSHEKSAGQLLSARTAREGQLRALEAPSALAACLIRALGADVGDPLAVDLAQFNGEPAVLVALPALGRSDKVDVYVLDPACPEGAFVYFARLPLPTPR